jgi:hypothetical protein
MVYLKGVKTSNVMFNKRVWLPLLAIISLQYNIAQDEVETYSFSIKDQDQSYIFSNLLLSKNGTLWYVTRSCVYFRRGTHSHKLLFDSNLLANRFDNPIYEDHQGFIWIGATKGVYKINATTLDFSYIPTLSKNTLSSVTSFAQDVSTNDIWISLEDDTLLKCKDDKIVKRITIPKDHGNQRVKLVVSPNGLLVVDGWEQVYTLENDTLKWHKTKKFPNDVLMEVDYPAYLNINQKGFIYCPERKRSYEYLPKLGLCLVSGSEWAINRNLNTPFIGNRCIVRENNILYIDELGKQILHEKINVKNDSLIIEPIKSFPLRRKPRSLAVINLNEVYASYSGKIEKYRHFGLKIKHHLNKSFKELSVRSFASTSDGTVYCSTYRGLFHKKKGAQEFTEFVIKGPTGKNLKMAGLRIENDSILWGVNKEIYRINLRTKRVKIINSFDYYPFFINPINNKELWVGGIYGLSSFDTRNHTITSRNDFVPGYDFSEFRTYDMSESNGVYRFATSLGLLVYNSRSNQVKRYHRDMADSSIHTRVLDSWVSDSDELWMAGNEGLSVVSNSGETYNYKLADGLVNAGVQDIIEGPEGIWLTTKNGLSRVRKPYEISNLQFDNYLFDQTFNFNASLVANDSIMFFGGVDGCFEVDISKIGMPDHSPQIVPYRLKAYDSNEDVYLERTYFNTDGFKIELPYYANHFEFDFTISPSFNPTKDEYLYKLEGLYNDWVDLDNQGSVRLYGLPSGEYTLLIKGKNDIGIPVRDEMRIPIKIHEVFYKKTWFGTGIVFLIVSIGIVVRRNRKKRITEKSRFKKEIQNLRINALKTQLSPHFIFNAINGLQSEMILGKSREVNQYISSFSKILRINMAMIVKDSITIEEEVAYLDAYIKLQQQRNNNGFTFQIVTKNSAEENFRIGIPCMMIQPFVENAIEHGLLPRKEPGGELTIKFEVLESIHVLIIDNGVGRSKNLSFEQVGHSISSIKSRVNLINELRRKQITIDIVDLNKNEGETGTRVELRFPIYYKKS